MSIEEIDLKLSDDEAVRDEKLDAKGKFDFEDWLQKHKLQAIIGGLGIFFLGVGALSAVVLSSKQESSSIEILPAEEEQISEIFIHVSGAVQKPGLYQLSSDSRVNDALAAAGGLASDADREWFNKSVNLAQQLSDGVKLYIPYKSENLNPPTGGQSSKQEGVVAGEQVSIFDQQTKAKININTASISQLDSLPGIGPAYAQRIIDARPFSKIEDIMNVTGIGEKTFKKIKNKISVF